MLSPTKVLKVRHYLCAKLELNGIVNFEKMLHEIVKEYIKRGGHESKLKCHFITYPMIIACMSSHVHNTKSEKSV